MTVSSKSEVHTLARESLVSDQRLALVCGGCGKRGTYGVGKIIVDPRRIREQIEPAPPMEESIAFGGIFRCKQCGGSGPWTFPQTTRMKLFGMMLRRMVDGEESEIQFGILQAFDGTRPKCGAEAEDHLKSKIANSPDDAFLWDRLGNLYDNAGHPKLARQAYERAVEIDPRQIESNYSLGCYRMMNGDVQGAAECFQRIAKHARSAPRRPLPDRKGADQLEVIVQDTLERLLELNQQDDTIPFPPEFDIPPPQEPQKPDEPRVIYLTEFDLGTQEGWDTLTTLCLTGRYPEHMEARAWQATESARIEQHRRSPAERIPVALAAGKPRVGRNDPCPCGSGKKYKRCCG